jgi:hypothetical protein
VAFVSPSIEESSGDVKEDTEQALRDRDGARQANILARWKSVDEALGLKTTHSSTLGVWTDGAESSAMVVANASQIDYDTFVYATAVKARIASQKDAIAFVETEGGASRLYSVAVPSRDIRAVTESAAKAGLVYHTIQENGRDGLIVHVFEDTGSDEVSRLVQRFAKQQGVGNVDLREGRGVFLTDGSSSRAGAAKRYRDIERQYRRSYPDRNHYAEKRWNADRDHRRARSAHAQREAGRLFTRRAIMRSDANAGTTNWAGSVERWLVEHGASMAESEPEDGTVSVAEHQCASALFARAAGEPVPQVRLREWCRAEVPEPVRTRLEEWRDMFCRVGNASPLTIRPSSGCQPAPRSESLSELHVQHA